MSKKLVIGIVIMAVVALGFYFGFRGDDMVDVSEELNEEMDAVYEVTFDATWSSETHPEDFPSNDHWSGLIGATHNGDVVFWEKDGIASDGIKLMAETGGKVDLITEVEAEIVNGYAEQVLSGSGIGSGVGQSRITFNITKDYPLVTLTSMIAPSPDWFVGVNSLNLYENNKWIDEIEIDLLAYDAGTDSGEGYTSSNQATVPREPISDLSYSRTSFGKFIFKKLN